MIIRVLFVLAMSILRSTGLKTASRGISFTGAGLLTPFHIGVSQFLREKGLIDDSIPICGSSGGALSTVISALGLSPSDTIPATTYISNECRLKGTRYTLRVALDKVLYDVLPNDAATLLNNRPSKVSLAYAQIFPEYKSCVVSKFEDKDDLISVMRASCNIPLYFNGNNLAVDVRQGGGIDGLFAFQFARFGAPPTYQQHEIIITPFPPTLVGLRPKPLEFIINDETDNTNTSSNNNNNNRIYRSENDSDFIVYSSNNLESDDENQLKSNIMKQQIDIISPTLLSSSEWLLSTIENFQLAVLPPTTTLSEDLDRKLSKFGTIAYDILKTSKIQCVKSYQGYNSDIELVYIHLYNCGILCAHKWYQNTYINNETDQNNRKKFQSV